MTTAAPAAAPSGSYVARHWRGELSLAKSFWLNGFVLGLVFRIAFSALLTGTYAAAASGGGPSIGLALVFLALMALNIALVVWQLVGIWRSAGHQAERGGSKAWGVVARIVVIVGALGSVVIEVANFGGFIGIITGNY